MNVQCLNPEIEKQCTDCEEVKPLSEFKKYTKLHYCDDQDGYGHVCNACTRLALIEKMRTWRQKEKLKREAAERTQAMRPSDGIVWQATLKMPGE